MYKVCQFPGVDPHSGSNTVQRIEPGNSAALEKTARALHPEIQRYVTRLKPHPDRVYVLVIALGASEYYGQNINGDIFPEVALTHRGTDYGYQTFLNGRVFKHHQNKNPELSFGTIPLSVWNDNMKRVELILELSKERAVRFDAMDIIEKIEAGVPCAVSMGCKVPYDVCTKCHNKAKTREDYCYHLKYEMNKVYGDGSQAGAVNTIPRFFDLSFVFIGADKIAYTVCKIASNGYCALCEKVSALKQANGEEKEEVEVKAKELKEYQTKAASAGKVSTALKNSTSQKFSDIVKETPSTFVRSAVPLLEDSEPDISKGVLNEMGSCYSLQDALATPSSMGMILKPREFQRIVLIRLGHGRLADDLDSCGEVFQQSSKVDDSISFGRFRPELAQSLMPHMQERSGFGPILKKRILRILIVRPKIASIEKTSKKDFLDKIAQGYNGYRLRVLSDMPSGLDAVLEQNPDLTAELFQEGFLEAFSKSSAVGTKLIPIKPLLGVFPVLYFLSAHWKAQELHGRKLGFVKKFVAEHPELSALLLAGAWGGAARRGVATAAKVLA